MRTRLLIATMMVLAAMMPVQAQYTQTDRIARGVLNGINSVLDSQERKQRAEIHAREKAQYQGDFTAAMDEARELEEDGKYAEALVKYEEAAVLNWKYEYTDQRNITRKITSLYGPAGRTEEGPSVMNNDKVTLADYSGYRFLRENPIYKADKNAGKIQILRVCCSDTETRVEIEYENDELTSKYYQRWLSPTGWTDVDWFLFSYENGKVSDWIHQRWDTLAQNWHNYEKETYEYHPEEERAYIISQSWDNEWINRYRATNFISHGRLVIDSTQKWQNEKWVDFTACDYTFDDAGNFIEARWKDYIDGEWIDSDYNIKTIVSYNDGVSILCDYIQSFQARYSSTNSTPESHITNQTTVFPNPGTNQLTIQADTPFTDVIVYDMTGRQIFSQSVSETAIHINTASWPSGVYFWKVHNSSSVQCGKWVKN